MASTFPTKPANIIQGILGYSTGTTFYTVVPGTFVYIGTDGTGVADRVVPCTTISSHLPIGVIYAGTSAQILALTKNGEVSVAVWPFLMNTDNVDPTNPPESAADKLVFLLNAGTLSDTDTNTSGWSLGQCIKITSTNAEPYLINFDSPKPA